MQPLPQFEHGLDSDLDRVNILRDLGPDSEHYFEYGLTLRDYGFSTLMRQWQSGELLPLVSKKMGVAIPEAPKGWDLRVIRSIAALSVARSVEPFLKSAILEGGWDPGRGTRLHVYFVGRCYRAFADDYRGEVRKDNLARETLFREGRQDLELDVLAYLRRSGPVNTEDPEDVAIKRDEVRRLLATATHAQIPEIIFLMGEGMKYKDIGACLQMTENAVSNAVRKFRGDIERAHRRT